MLAFSSIFISKPLVFSVANSLIDIGYRFLAGCPYSKITCECFGCLKVTGILSQGYLTHLGALLVRLPMSPGGVDENPGRCTLESFMIKIFSQE